MKPWLCRIAANKAKDYLNVIGETAAFIIEQAQGLFGSSHSYAPSFIKRGVQHLRAAHPAAPAGHRHRGAPAQDQRQPSKKE